VSPHGLNEAGKIIVRKLGELGHTLPLGNRLSESVAILTAVQAGQLEPAEDASETNRRLVAAMRCLMEAVASMDVYL
jgi:hypothetical protein